MKKTYLLIIILLIIIIYLIIKNNKTTYIVNNTNSHLTKINNIDESHKTKIQIYFPITKYPKLNRNIKSFIDTSLNTFKSNIKDAPKLEVTYYTFYILYDEYYYKDYISISFYQEEFTGGAHPNHTIKTINYNTLTNKIITIDDLIKINPSLLNSLSSISRNKLKNSEKFKSHLDLYLLNEGTLPNKENFKNFTLTKEGLKIYFDYYQIAPYYYGTTEIIIPYNEINLSL